MVEHRFDTGGGFDGESKGQVWQAGAVLLGAALVVIDSVLADLGEARDASKAADAAEKAETAEVVGADEDTATPD